MYTSGSTGRPKGVGIAHGALAAHTQVARDFFGLQPGERMLQFSTFNFDGFVEQLYPALCCGATVVLRGPDLWDSEELYERIVRHRINVLDLTTAYWFQVVQDWATRDRAAKGSRDYGVLRQVNVGGEAMPPEGLAAWRDAGLAHVRLLNTYGPTEAAVTAMLHNCADYVHGRRARPRQMPIGQALPGRAIYLLDRDANPVPFGVAGELCIGGDLLARGYHGRPELTAERFIPDPFGAPGARLYRTGDLARWRADGVIEYLGRIDHQVKIRGFRIELPEIEARLLAHPAIREALVLACEDRPGGKLLVAYLVAQDVVDNDALRAHLKAALPDYMVPSAFVHLATMPMSPNGKLDRQALPAPQAETHQAHYAAPGTPAEAALARIWAEVLGMERVGIHDNFFQLGGDSILVLQIVSRSKRAGWAISPKDLFQHQTVALLAAAARKEAVATDTGPVTGEVPLSPIQCWFFEQSFAETHHWNQSILLEARQAIDAGQLEQALAALLQHHDALSLRFARGGDARWRQAYADDARQVELQAIDLSKVATDALPERLHAACNRVQASLNLEQGPLLAVAHIHLPEGGERLLLVIHHLVVDGVSWRILLEDLQTACAQLCAGQAVNLGAKSHSYRAWAERLRAYAHSPACRQELDYWRSAVKPMTLPARDPHGENLAGTAERIDVRLDVEETRQLLQQAPAAYRTRINDLLLSALAQAMCRWSGTEHALIELEGHGREDVLDGIDVSRTVGWFTSRFPVCLTPAKDPGATIKAVKEQLRRVPNNGFGWGVLEYLSDDDTRSAIKALPQPQISFNYFGQFGRAAEEAAAFAFARESDGDTVSPSGHRTHWLEVNGHIAGDSLSFGWTFSPALHDRRDIEQLAHDYLRELRALIAHCLHTEGGATPSDFPLADLSQAEIDRLSLNSIEDIYPLAPMQQGMLFHSLYAPGADVYVNQFHCVLRGGIAFDAFRTAWEQAVARHAILRTSFLWQREGEALQLVRRHAALPFQRLDWHELPASEHAAWLADFLAADQARGFTVEQAPLMRLTLIERYDGAAEFIWTSHHLLLDGWSTAQLLDEVLAGYFAQLDGDTLDLPRPRRYRDYVEWVRQQPADAAERYWRDNLAGLSAPLRITEAIARPSPAEAGYSERTLSLSAEETGALQQFAQRQRVTFNTLLQGAWALLLWRYSGRRDVVFGVTVAGRPTELAGADAMLGLFINTLPMHCRLDPAQEAGAWLRQLQNQNAEARQFQTTPLADIQRWSVAGGGNALFDSLLVFENYPVDATLRQAGARLAVDVTRKADLTSYPVTLTVVPGAQLRLSLTCDRAQVGEAAVERLQAHLTRLLLGFVEREEARLRDIALLSATEFRQLTGDWNATARDYPLDRPVHALFEAQAAATPDALALICGTRQFTYGELNAQANRLAHRLIGEGVKHDSLVGLCTERSAEMVVALLAILKAGGAYVPLDPDYPRERLAHMVEDAGLALLLTQRRVRERLALERPGLPLMELDLLDTSLADLPVTNPGLALSGEHLAYAIYTSGSTGKPKGVMVRHAALSNFLFSMREAPGLQAHDVLMAVTSLSFDIAALEIYLPLICGARLVLAERELAADGPRLTAAMTAVGATALQATPATWRMLVESGWQ
jgi:amino acid adenylation domain-containing protein/non-ribosomal peptide synthase protein (TIGR01720 family)